MSTLTNGRSAPVAANAATTTRAWTVHDASELYEVARWGNGYFSVNAAGHVQVHPTKDPAQGDRPEGADRSPAAARHQPAGARPLHRHPEASARRHPRRLPGGHRAAPVPGRLQLRLPDQGEPAAAGGRGGAQLRPALPVRPRGGLEAGAARRRGGRRQRDADHLQRLQGRRVHRDGDAGPEDGPATSSPSSRNTPSSR